MTKRTGSFRRKTRYKFLRPIREKGKMSVQNYFQMFQVDEKVILHANSSLQQGMYFPRFHGKQGVITGKQGHCYKVLIKDYKKEKTLIIHPLHLVKCQTLNS